ncbi:MAG: hypothetical protein E7438_07155 [Ruminococcaceae bacterium]|nr:hypothetical protein [Oscillospiraceae bacterium]
MVKRRTNIVAAILAVTLGGFLYVLLRENTYIAKVFSDNQIVVLCRTAFVGQEWYAVSCYLPDFLWGFALSCSMIAVFEPSKVGVFAVLWWGYCVGHFGKRCRPYAWYLELAIYGTY